MTHIVQISDIYNGRKHITFNISNKGEVPISLRGNIKMTVLSERVAMAFRIYDNLSKVCLNKSLTILPGETITVSCAAYHESTTLRLSHLYLMYLQLSDGDHKKESEIRIPREMLKSTDVYNIDLNEKNDSDDYYDIINPKKRKL